MDSGKFFLNIYGTGIRHFSSTILIWASLINGTLVATENLGVNYKSLNFMVTRGSDLVDKYSTVLISMKLNKK